MANDKFAVGDLDSDEKGSGARANAGKPDLSMIPLRIIADSMADWDQPSRDARNALRHLGRFQETHDPAYLYRALDHMLPDRWADCAKVFTYGITKYKAWNWAKGMPWSVPLACAARHIAFGILQGETHDAESGETHRGHVFCNIVMLLTYTNTFKEGNDLPPVGLLGDGS